MFLKNIDFKYGGIAASEKWVLRNLSLRLGEKQCTAVVGPSGSGKTTLIQHFTGLLKPASGTVFFDDRDIWARGFPLTELRQRIGLVFQFPESQLFEETVFRDVSFGPKNMRLSAKEVEKRARDALQAVELDPDAYGTRSPFKLSEGEKRRVAIAGVLAMEPEMMVFDEPTAGLDARGVQTFQTLVRRLVHQQKSVVIVTHDMDLVAEVAHRVVILLDGQIISEISPRDLFADANLLERAGLELPQFIRALHRYESSLPARLHQAVTLAELLTLLKK